MAKFRFRLKTLLQVRRTERDQRRAELAQAYQAEEILREQRKKLQTEIDLLRQQRNISAGTIDVDALIEGSRYEFVLSSQRKTLEEQSGEVSQEIERRRQILVAVDQQVRMLEKLEEKQRQQFQAEQQRKETKELDEIVLMRKSVEPL